MTEFPFQLLVKDKCAKNKKESLRCTTLLRSIAETREVYDGLWNGRSVIVKVFSHKLKARYHFKREWQGMNALRERGLNSPEPLFYGQTKDGHLAIVVEKIADCSTVLDVFEELRSKADKFEVLVSVCRELAKQHSKGVLQKDLHLGNFLLGGDKVFALDAGQMRFLRREADRKSSIFQLAMLACYLPDSDKESIRKLYDEYARCRGWDFGKSDEEVFENHVLTHRQRTIRRGLKKCLRTSKRYLRIKADGYLAVFDKGFCEGTEPVDFIKRIDFLMDEGEIFKKGNTCYVSYLRWNDKNVVIKRYNHKGSIHSLRHTIKRSRARRGWLNGHRLRMLNIATPRPLAYIEKHKGGLVWESYLITEYAKGRKLYDFMRDGKTDENQRSKVTKQVKELLDKLGRHRITHGDLKHTNILVSDNGPIITDLDSMKVYKWNWLYKAKRTKDIAHFTNR